MTLYLMNPKFELVEVVEGYKTSIWSERFDADGDALVVFPLKAKRPSDYPRDYYLYHDESTELMQIKKRFVKVTDDGERVMEVHATSISSILKQRIAWGTFNISNRLEPAVKHLLDLNIIAPTDVDRKVSNLRFEYAGPSVPSIYNVEAQIVDTNLHTAIRDLCKVHDIGFSVRMLSLGVFTFQLQGGVNRSYDQEQNPYVVFSPEFDNLGSASLLLDSTDFRNVVRVGGEGSGSDKKYRTVKSGSPSGLDRYEGYFDAPSLSSDKGTVPPNTYNAYLDTKGREYLEDHRHLSVFDGESDDATATGFGDRFYLGDIVQIDDSDLISSPARIVEFIRSDDEQNGVQNFPALRIIN